MITEDVIKEHPVKKEPGSNACAVLGNARKDGIPSHDTVIKTLKAKARMFHRGGYNIDNKTTDGDGIETDVPFDFFKDRYESYGLEFPENSRPAVGQFFLPQDKTLRAQAWEIIKDECKKSNITNYVTHDLDVNYDVLGEVALKKTPYPAQIIFPVEPGGENLSDAARCSTDIKLSTLRERINSRLSASGLMSQEDERNNCHAASFSADIIIYKAMSDPKDEGAFFACDLHDQNYKARLAIGHNRFTTAGETTIDNVQPLPSAIAHNGTITTQKGLANASIIHEGPLAAMIGPEGQDMMPLSKPGASDSNLAGRIAEAYRLAGKSFESIKMRLFPKGKNRDMDVSDKVKAARRYFSYEIESADGPALVVLTNGEKMLLALDANGSRPAAIEETDEYFSFASEAGAYGYDIDNELTDTDTLKAGKMLEFNTRTGVVTHDRELEERVANEEDFEEYNRHIKDIPFDNMPVRENLKYNEEELALRMRYAGYSSEDLSYVLQGIAESKESNGSMGETTISRGSGLHKEISTDNYTWLHNQIVAPAHNSSLDGDMMDLSARLSYPLDQNGQLKDEVHVIDNRFVLTSPMFKRTRITLGEDNFRFIDCTYDLQNETPDQALKRIGQEAVVAAKAGKHVILSDEFITHSPDPEKNKRRHHMPIKMTLATGEAHTQMTKAKLRGDVALFVKSGEIHNSNHVGQYKAIGATGVIPYLIEQKIIHMHKKGRVKDKAGNQMSLPDAINGFLSTLDQGTKVIMQRTLTLSANSMQGALQFEANGLDRDLVERVHPGVASALSGPTLESLHEKDAKFHNEIFNPTIQDRLRVFDSKGHAKLHTGGRFKSKAGGIKHGVSANAIYALRVSLNIGSSWDMVRGARLRATGEDLGEYTKEKGRKFWIDHYLPTNRGSLNPAYEIDGLDIVPDKKNENTKGTKVPSVKELLKSTLVISAMSIGAISIKAHKNIHKVANEEGFESNTGEGGYPEELLNDPNFMPKIVQWSTNWYGIRPQLLRKAQIIEFKFGQGAKSGEGGNMPAKKVGSLLSRLRFIPKKKEQQSSPLHMDMRSIEDLKQKIKLALRLNPQAEIRIKIVAKDGCDFDALGAAKAMNDAIEELAAEGVKTSGKMSIHLSNRRGGTASAKNASKWATGSDGVPYIAKIHRILKDAGYRQHVQIITDGGLSTGEDFVKSLMLGADKVGIGTLAMQASGCTMQEQCQTGECMTDVAVSKEEEDIKNFEGTEESIRNMAHFLMEDVQKIMKDLGVETLDELKGRTDLLKVNEFGKVILERDYSVALKEAFDPSAGSHYLGPKTNPIRKTDKITALDQKILFENPDLIKMGGTFNLTTKNFHDGFGVTIAGNMSEYILSQTTELDEALLKKVVPDDHIVLNAKGYAGYATASLLPQGMSYNLYGVGGDSFGIGNRAGIASIIYPKNSRLGRDPKKSKVLAHALVGAFSTGGEVHVPGIVGNDAAFRQSGGLIVVRGAGKACQQKARGTFIAWKDGVDDGSFEKHEGGESFVRKEGIKSDRLVQKFHKQQKSVHFEVLQDPAAKQRLREHLLRSFQRTQDPELKALLTRKNWNSVAEEFMHVRTFSEVQDKDRNEPDVPMHAYPLVSDKILKVA